MKGHAKSGSSPAISEPSRSHDSGLYGPNPTVAAIKEQSVYGIRDPVTTKRLNRLALILPTYKPNSSKVMLIARQSWALQTSG